MHILVTMVDLLATRVAMVVMAAAMEALLMVALLMVATLVLATRRHQHTNPLPPL